MKNYFVITGPLPRYERSYSREESDITEVEPEKENDYETK